MPGMFCIIRKGTESRKVEQSNFPFRTRKGKLSEFASLAGLAGSKEFFSLDLSGSDAKVITMTMMHIMAKEKNALDR